MPNPPKRRSPAAGLVAAFTFVIAILATMAVTGASFAAPPASQPSFSVDVNEKTKVTLVGVSSYPPDENSWFAADGSPIDAPEDKALQTQFNAQPEPAHLMLLRVQKPAGVHVQLMMHGATSCANHTSTDDEGDRGVTTMLIAFDLQNAVAKTVGLELGIADSDWRSIALNDHPKEGSETEAPGIGSVAFDPAEDGDGGARVVVHCAHFDGPCQLVAFDDAGKDHKASNINVSTDGTTATCTFNFELPLDKVAKFALQTRPISRFVQISDVSLEKGTVTKPEMKVREEK